MDTEKTTNAQTAHPVRRNLRIGSRLGKYRLEKRLGRGGYATVYAAQDTLLGIKALRFANRSS